MVFSTSTPGAAELLQSGVGVTGSYQLDISTAVGPSCVNAVVTIGFKSEVAITYTNWTGTSTNVFPNCPLGNCQLCSGDNGASCAGTPLAPIDGVYIPLKNSCSGGPNNSTGIGGQQWYAVSKCFGFGPLGPECFDRPEFTVAGLPTTGGKPCTQLSTWPQ